MAEVVVKSAPTMMPSSSIERLKELKVKTPEAEKARLRQATKEFESYFMYEMLKTMRKTVPKSEFNKGGPFESDNSKEIFTEMFDMQLAGKMVKGDRNSISEILYKSLEKLVDAKYTGSDGSAEIKPLSEPKPEPVQIRSTQFRPVPKASEPVAVETRTTAFVPVVSVPTAAKPAKPTVLPVTAVDTERDESKTTPFVSTGLVTDKIMSRFGEYIEQAAKDTALDPILIASVIQAESDGNPTAVSPAGAKGLMQLADSTASDMGVKEVFNPEENIQAGSKYLKRLIDRFGSVRLGLAAYNAGPQNVMRHGDVPPFKETQNYVRKVLDTLGTVSGVKPGVTAKE